MSDTIRAAVESILSKAEVTFSATYRGLKKKALGGAGEMDEWSVSFTKRDGRAAHEEFEFFTGLGLRDEASVKESQLAKYDFPGLTQNDIDRRTIYGRRYLARKEELRKPKAPCAADVLHSLILDSQAVGQSFESWSDDFGYDTDSRKAYAIYQACQENADKLARVFSHADTAALAEALQDY